jgi:uncharacterized protein HemX
MDKKMKLKHSSPKKNSFLRIGSVLIIFILAIILGLYVNNYARKGHYAGVISIRPNVRELQTKLTEQQLILESLQNKVQDLSSGKEKITNYLVLMEIDHLIQIAKFYLFAEKDVRTAIKFLADAELSTVDLKTPAALTIREALIRDIKNLENIPDVDMIKVAMQIAALNQQISTLYNLPKSLMPPTSDRESIKATTKDKSQNWQSRFWQQALKSIKSAFIIHHLPQDSLPLLPEQNYHMVLEMQSKLQLAEWGWVHYQKAFYQANLQQLVNLLQNYLPRAEANGLTNILLKVKGLQKINPPEIALNILDNSQHAVQTALKQ